jgi:hypothetical protein
VSIADIIAVAEYAVAFLALTFFVIGYISSTRGRALRTAEGRHMLHFRGSLALWMVLGVVNNLAGDYPGRDWVRNAVIGWFMLAALGGDLLMVRAQLARRRLPTATPSAPSTEQR